MNYCSVWFYKLGNKQLSELRGRRARACVCLYNETNCFVYKEQIQGPRGSGKNSCETAKGVAVAGGRLWLTEA